MQTFPLTLAALLLSAEPAAAEVAAQSRITSVGLFKNGLAVVRREVAVPGPGVYRLDDVPEPVHGTYWVESLARVESAVQTREVEVPAEPAGADLRQELAGRRVTLHFRSDKLPPLTGTVVPLPREQPDETAGGGGEAHVPYPVPRAASRYLVLETARGRAYIEPGDIAFCETEGPIGTRKRRRPVLLLTVGPEVKQPTTVTISYLAHGLAWAPSYRIDTSDPRRLTLEQGAVVRNEMADLANVETSLITGFPSLPFAHVGSPLLARNTWARFFVQLSERPRLPRGAAAAMTQQIAMTDYSPQGSQVNFLPGHEGADLYYDSIGRRTLGRGDTLALTTRKGQADYERIVEWLIADHRDAYGNPTARRGDEAEGESADDAPWDALRFKNPFTLPLTTGPALVLTQGRVQGQRLLHWVNAGEETTLRVTKALSIRTRAVEHEQQTAPGASERDVVYIGGRRFRRVAVEGEVALCNHRGDAVKVLIRRRFSGDLVKAAGDPKVSLLEEGVYAVNRRNELVWTVTLRPGEEKTLAYQYAVLVHF